MPDLGRTSVAAHLGDQQRELARRGVEVVGDVTDGNRAAIEWQAVLTSPHGVDHDLHGVNVIEVRDDKFVSVRAYFDPTIFTQHL